MRRVERHDGLHHQEKAAGGGLGGKQFHQLELGLVLLECLGVLLVNDQPVAVANFGFAAGAVGG